MLHVMLVGPQASGKTLVHEVIQKHKAEIEEKTGHEIHVIECYPQSGEKLPVGIPVEDKSPPRFKVYRFKPTGKFDMEFELEAPGATRMEHACDALREARKLPKGYSMVIVCSLNQNAEEIFYPCEVK